MGFREKACPVSPETVKLEQVPNVTESALRGVHATVLESVR